MKVYYSQVFICEDEQSAQLISLWLNKKYDLTVGIQGQVLLVAGEPEITKKFIAEALRVL